MGRGLAPDTTEGSVTLKCWEAIIFEVNSNGVMDAERAKYLGRVYGANGPALALCVVWQAKTRRRT